MSSLFTARSQSCLSHSLSLRFYLSNSSSSPQNSNCSSFFSTDSTIFKIKILTVPISLNPLLYLPFKSLATSSPISSPQNCSCPLLSLFLHGVTASLVHLFLQLSTNESTSKVYEQHLFLTLIYNFIHTIFEKKKFVTFPSWKSWIISVQKNKVNGSVIAKSSSLRC